MKRISIISVAMIALSALSIPALAQDAGMPVRVVHSGNTDIIFESANSSDLNVPQLKAFDDFASDHADIAAQLGRKPQLLSSDQYLSAHPELAQFVNQHPGFRDDFETNPGNYLHLAPGVERKVEHNQPSA
jgi:hypothetical protein